MFQTASLSALLHWFSGVLCGFFGGQDTRPLKKRFSVQIDAGSIEPTYSAQRFLGSFQKPCRLHLSGISGQDRALNLGKRACNPLSELLGINKSHAGFNQYRLVGNFWQSQQLFCKNSDGPPKCINLQHCLICLILAGAKQGAHRLQNTFGQGSAGYNGQQIPLNRHNDSEFCYHLNSSYLEC